MKSPWLEVEVPTKWQDVSLSSRLQTNLSRGWHVAQDNSSRHVPMDEFLDSALAQLQQHHVIALIQPHTKHVGRGPFMVILWERRRHPDLPMWLPHWEVDWEVIWESIVPAESGGRLIWIQKAPIPWDRKKRLADIFTPSLAW